MQHQRYGNDSEDSEELPYKASLTKHFNFNRAAVAEQYKRANARKSLMHMDLDRLASEANNRGEQHFSFTNATGGGQETAKNKGSKGDALKMI